MPYFEIIEQLLNSIAFCSQPNTNSKDNVIFKNYYDYLEKLTS